MKLKPNSRRSFETADARIDRLSIIAVKAHHIQRQVYRVEAGTAHIGASPAKVADFGRQLEDLESGLDVPLEDAPKLKVLLLDDDEGFGVRVFFPTA